MIAMTVEIFYHEEFKRQLKRLAKKYPSMKDDFKVFLESLSNNPLQGIDLGNNVRKIRFAITSKGKGKSGGARVITYNVLQESEKTAITLLAIYDKSEMTTVTDNYIRSLLSTL